MIEGAITVTTNVTGAAVKVVSGTAVVATASAIASESAIKTPKVANGTYTVVVSKDGYKETTKEVTVNGDTEVSVELEKITATAEKATAVDNKKIYISGKGLEALKANDVIVAGKAVKELEVRKDNTLMATVAEDMTPGSAYEVKVADKTFTVIAKPADTTALTVTSITPKSSTLVEVQFDADDADDLSILDPANYVFDNDLKAQSVTYKYDSDNNKVLNTVYVTTTKQAMGKVYTATINGVKDYAGNASKDQKKPFAGIGEDKNAPTLKMATPSKGNKVTVTFTDDSQLDAASLTNTANYTIDGLTVKKATVKTNSIEGGDAVVELETSDQTVGKLYTLKISNIADIYGNKPEKALETSFAGTALDKDAPYVVSAVAKTNTLVQVTFDDTLDKTTATTIANYKIDGLTILGAKLEKDEKTVTLTTTAQTAGKIYEVVVSNVKDEAGNVITTAQNYKASFAGLVVDTTKPTVRVDTTSDKNTVVLLFDEDVDADTATTLTNYSIAGLGYPTSVKYDSTTHKATLVTSNQTNGKSYEITINNVKDLSGNVIEKDTKVTFTGVGNASETLKIANAVALNNKQVKVVFNKDVPNSIALAKFTFDKSITTKSVTPIDSKTYIVTTNEELTNKVYTLTVNADVTDIGENAIDAKGNTFKFGGLTTAPATPKVKAVSQTSSKVLTVYFDQEVSGSDTAVALDYEDGTQDLTGGTLAIDTTDKTKATVTFTNEITGGKVATLKLTVGETSVADITGENKIAATTKGSTTYDFKFGTQSFNFPVLKMTSATAINEHCVELTYNQSILADDLDKETFAIKDENGTTATTIASAKKVDSNKVRVYYSEALKAGKLYTIETVTSNVDDIKDLNGKANVSADIATNLTAKFGANTTADPAAKLVSVVPLGSKVVQVTFSKAIDSTLAITDFELSVNNGAAKAFTDEAALNTVDANKGIYTITLKSNKGTFVAGNKYKLSIKDAVTAKDANKVAAIASKDANNNVIAVEFGGTASDVLTAAMGTANYAGKIVIDTTKANTANKAKYAFADTLEAAKTGSTSGTEYTTALDATTATLTVSKKEVYLAVTLTDELGSTITKTYKVTGNDTAISNIVEVK